MIKKILIKKFSKLIINVIAYPCLKEKSQLELIPLLPIAFLIVKHCRRLRRTLKGWVTGGFCTKPPLPFPLMKTKRMTPLLTRPIAMDSTLKQNCFLLDNFLARSFTLQNYTVIQD